VNIKSLTTIVLSVFFSVAAVFLADSYRFHNHASPAANVDTIRAPRIEIVDDKGAPFISLGTVGAGGSAGAGAHDGG
jgi:hypothetical protein